MTEEHRIMGRAGRLDPRSSAFTLLELLTVIAIIAILAGIVIGVGRRAAESGRISRAKAELAVLAAALEAYKRTYGDYPQAGNANHALIGTPATASDANVRLFNALCGAYGPKLAAMQGRNQLDLARFALEFTDAVHQPAPPAAVINSFLDPWGNRYVYCYKVVDSTVWTNPSYVLYSVGPDGAKAAAGSDCDQPPTTAGLVDPAAAVNADNIYANRY